MKQINKKKQISKFISEEKKTTTDKENTKVYKQL